MEKSISGISLAPMPNGSHFNFMQSTLERAKANGAVKNKISKEVDALEEAWTQENLYLKVSTKSVLTGYISTADSKRDTFLGGYRHSLKGFLSLPDAEMQEAAKILWEHNLNYAIDPQSQLDKQTGMMANFIEDLEGPLAAEVAKLGLTPFVTSMKAANEEVRTLMMQRDTEKSAKTVGATKAARAKTDDAYRTLIKKVNALALVEGDELYASFIDEMNAQIVRYKREVLGQKVDTSKPGLDTTPDDDGGDEDDTPIEVS